MVFFPWAGNLTSLELKFSLSVKGRWLYLSCILHGAKMLKFESTLNNTMGLDYYYLWPIGYIISLSVSRGTHTHNCQRDENLSYLKEPRPGHAFVSIIRSFSFIHNWNSSLPGFKSFPRLSFFREQLLLCVVCPVSRAMNHVDFPFFF